MASWIEIVVSSLCAVLAASRLMWPRGLKYLIINLIDECSRVEAYVASWIEIIAVSYMTTGSVASRLIRPYGLK